MRGYSGLLCFIYKSPFIGHLDKGKGNCALLSVVDPEWGYFPELIGVNRGFGDPILKDYLTQDFRIPILFVS